MSGQRSQTIRVFLVDDHDVVRAGLRRLLEREPGFEVVGEAASGREALDLLAESRFDVVVLDFGLPDIDAPTVCRELAERRLPGNVVVLSGHLAEEAVRRSFLAGARGYVVKDADLAELKRAIRAVAQGSSYIDAKVAGRMMGWAASVHRPLSGPFHKRDLEILDRLVAGGTNAEIAQILGLSRHSVSTRLVGIFKKLGVRSRTEAVAAAIRRGLVNEATLGLAGRRSDGQPTDA